MPLHNNETLHDILERVKANVHRPPAHPALHRKPPVYMPDATQSCTHVYTKRAKVTPLSPRWDGPYEIIERMGNTSLKLKVGEYVNGTPRLETRHWNTCFPYTPGADCEEATRPSLGRKPLSARAPSFSPRRAPADEGSTETRENSNRLGAAHDAAVAGNSSEHDNWSYNSSEQYN